MFFLQLCSIGAAQLQYLQLSMEATWNSTWSALSTETSQLMMPHYVADCIHFWHQSRLSFNSMKSEEKKPKDEWKITTQVCKSILKSRWLALCTPQIGGLERKIEKNTCVNILWILVKPRLKDKKREKASQNKNHHTCLNQLDTL